VIALSLLALLAVAALLGALLYTTALYGRSEHRRASLDIDNARLLGALREAQAAAHGQSSRREAPVPSRPKPPASASRYSVVRHVCSAAPRGDPPDEEPTEVWTSPPSTKPEATRVNGRAGQ
jgi:hypothetical protein